MIILKYYMPMLQSQLKRLLSIKYFQVSIQVFMHIFFYSFSDTFISCLQLILRSELKKLLSIKYFLVFNTSIHAYFLSLLLRHIHLMSTDVHIDNIPLCKGLVKNQNKRCAFFIILSTCENWVSLILKILIQLDSSHRYDHFESLYACITIRIKEVIEHQIFPSFKTSIHAYFLSLL